MAEQRPGMNDTLPHGTEAAVLNHLAHGQLLCPVCEATSTLQRAQAAYEAAVAGKPPPTKRRSL